MLNDEQAAVFARLIAECAGAAYGNHGVDTADAYRVLMAYIGDLLAAERESAAVTAWSHYMDTCKRKGLSPAGEWQEWNAAAAIRALKGKQ